MDFPKKGKLDGELNIIPEEGTIDLLDCGTSSTNNIIQVKYSILHSIHTLLNLFSCLFQHRLIHIIYAMLKSAIGSPLEASPVGEEQTILDRK